MIYLIDSVGHETGMHLYDQSFKQTLASKGLDVTILSNFDTDGQKALFPNFYHGNRLAKLLRFAWALFRMLCFRLTHHDASDIYVYQSFGLRKADQFFIRCLLGWKNLYVIVHDIFEIHGAQGVDTHQASKLHFYFKHVPAVICHSHDTESRLKALGFGGRTCYFPHFSYEFSKEVIDSRVAPEVRNAIQPDKVNFLFFGQIRETKGIHILQEAIHLLEKHHPEFAQRAHIVIAGMDKGHIITDQPQPDFVTTILRHMDDSELNFLFEHRPVVLLPYTEIYQSGVLEVVIYFQCPAIMSDIPFFRQMVERYPSFGRTYDPNTSAALAQVLLQACQQSQEKFFEQDDIQRYEADHDCTALCQFLTSGK